MSDQDRTERRIGAVSAALFLTLVLASATQLAAMAIAAEDFTSDEPQQVQDIDIAAVDAYLEKAMVVAHIPGLALGIVRNDRIVHLRGFGTADPTGRPVTPQTPFALGSVSKSFTALAVTQLIEAGRLELDSPVQTQSPALPVDAPVVSADPRGAGKETAVARRTRRGRGKWE